MTFLAIHPQPACRIQRGAVPLPVAGLRFAGVMPVLRPPGSAPPRR